MIYHRYADNKGGMMMFAENESDVDYCYGNTHYIFNSNNAKVIHADNPDFVKMLIEILSDDSIENEYQASAKNLAEEANPDDIVDSAGIWDSELVEKIYLEIIEPNEYQAVITYNGAIVFDEEKVIEV